MISIILNIGLIAICIVMIFLMACAFLISEAEKEDRYNLSEKD